MLFTDQLGRTVELKQPPQRIISLVPSQTELLADLGLSERIAGITRFCIHPRSIYDSKPRVGGTKNINQAKIFSIMPDLIIGNKEENDRKQLESLMDFFPVWISDIKNFEEALEMITQTGDLTFTQPAALKLKEEIKAAFQPLTQKHPAYGNRRTAACLIWSNPYRSVSQDTFIHSMLELAGFVNVFADKEERYPVVSMEDLKNKQPAYILLTSEPFPFTHKHQAFMQGEFPCSRIILTDGELLSWYGSRLKKAAPYLQQLSDV